MFKLILALFSIIIVGCVPIEQDHPESYGSGYIYVNETLWALNNTLPYPFTVPEGEISCNLHPPKGREVYFSPIGFTDEYYIGTPLNQTAVSSLQQAHMSPNVPYSIIKGANLSEAIKVGLNLCEEMSDMLKSA